MYNETLRASVNQHLTEGVPSQNRDEHSQSSKVNEICDAFLQVLETRKATNLQNMITAHVCKSPPHLEAGLSEIAKLRSERLSFLELSLYSHGIGDNSEHAERAIEHICFLADVNRLYDTALGLYDLDLTLQVAQQSQKVCLSLCLNTYKVAGTAAGSSGISTVPPKAPRNADAAETVYY